MIEIPSTYSDGSTGSVVINLDTARTLHIVERESGTTVTITFDKKDSISLTGDVAKEIVGVLRESVPRLSVDPVTIKVVDNSEVNDVTH